MFASNANQQRESTRRADAPNHVPDTRQGGENSRLRNLAQRIPRLNAVPVTSNNDPRPSSSTDFRVQSNTSNTQHDFRTAPNLLTERNLPNSSNTDSVPNSSQPDFRMMPNSSSNSAVYRAVQSSSNADFRVAANSNSSIDFRVASSVPNDRVLPTGHNDNIRVPWSERSRNTRTWDSDYVLRLPILDISRVQGRGISQPNHSLNNNDNSGSQDSSDVDFN